MRSALAAAALFLAACPASAELLWPLQQPPEDRALSSSFCEDRGSHLHGGVDMSTGGRVGVPVVAVADGAVVRVKVKYRGLGRAIYLQHAGGLMSVYGHLAGFAEPVRSKIDALIAQRGMYPGDWFPDEPIPVKAGQVIAWSGKTGGGPPHLHFETRRGGGNRPVDPWAEGLPCAVDTTPPRIDALAVMRPPDLGDEELHSLPLDRPLELDGSELLRVRVADPLGAGTGFVRRLTLSLGARELYRWDAAAYTYGVTRFAGHSFSRSAPAAADESAPGSWLWLASWTTGGLPFVETPAPGSRWELGAPGDDARLDLEAADGCGNTVELALPVRVSAPATDAGAAWSSRGSPDGSRVLARRSFLDSSPPVLDSEPAVLAFIPESVRGLPIEARLVEAVPGSQAPPPDGLRMSRPAVEARPTWLPLARKATLRIRLPEHADLPRLGIYRWNPATREWQFWGDDVTGGGRLGTTTDRLGTFALLEDAFPPRVAAVERRAVRGQPWRDDADELVVRYEERGEGLGWDGIRFRPEGSTEEWIAAHDPDEAEAAFVLPATLSGGRVVGTLVLEDHAGHLVEVPVDSSP